MRRFEWLIGVLLVAIAQKGFAQDPATYRPLFNDDSVLKLTIEGPFTRLTRERHSRPEMDGVVHYTNDAGQEVVLDVGLSPRGKSRLNLCSFPPLWLNFKRSQVPGTEFAGQNRLKLVTLCRDSDAYRDYLVQEYQTYRAFNALTDRSFRVRWVEIEYVETEGRSPSSTISSAFIIERNSEVAERNGMENARDASFRIAQLDPAGAALVSLFQYMIGNTDWSPIAAEPGESCCHNTKLIRPAGSDTEHIVLPYDFDQIGLINASYAKPSASMNIASVTRRVYRGYCTLNEELAPALRLLNERREEVEAALALGEVRARARARAQSYLAESYDRINDPRRFERDIRGRCRG